MCHQFLPIDRNNLYQSNQIYWFLLIYRLINQPILTDFYWLTTTGNSTTNDEAWLAVKLISLRYSKGTRNHFPSQGFWYFTQSRTRKFRYFREIPQNSKKNTKYREIRQKYFQIHVDKTYLILILAIRPVLFTPNVQIYLETSSLQWVNNVSKLPGVLRWTLWKTGH